MRLRIDNNMFFDLPDIILTQPNPKNRFLVFEVPGPHQVEGGHKVVTQKPQNDHSETYSGKGLTQKPNPHPDPT